MSSASISYRAHVPCWGSLGIDREPVAVRICARLRWRAHSGIKNAQTPPAIQSAPVTSFERAISGVSSLARAAWGRTVERSRTIFALRFVPAFSRLPLQTGCQYHD